MAGGWIGGIKGMSPGSATLSPPQTTSQLALFTDIFFSPFSRNVEPGPRL